MMQSPHLEKTDPPLVDPDRALVDRYCAGDCAAGEAIYAKVAAMMRAVVVRVLGPQRTSDWDDVFQAALLRFLAKAGQWRGECPLLNFAAVVAARVAIQAIRAKGVTLLAPDSETLRALASREPGPASRAASREAIDRLAEMCRQFPPAWQLALELHHSGVNHDEIAQRIRKSRRTVQYWLAEMYDRLLPCLE